MPTGQVDVAIGFAAITVHSGQRRKTDETPYIFHPMAVARLVAEGGGTETAIIAAIMHDAVEDTGLSLEVIERNFGPQVAALVDVLTEDKTKTWFERKAHTIDTVRSWSEPAQLIKLADVVDNLDGNLRYIKKWGPEKLWSQFKQGREFQYWYNAGIFLNMAAGVGGPLRDHCFESVSGLWLDLVGTDA